jgi:G:T-mismatch repair DNA endonuclease (very short patch repair protein)
MLCLKKLRCEIALSDAILLDKTTDIASKSQLSKMVRYVTDNATAEEQFLGFNNVCGDRSAKALAEQVFKCLDEYGIGKKKLRSQTYKRAAVMAGELNGLQSCVMKKYSDTLFVHCCAHRLSCSFSGHL